jgi:hypothetical protein
MSRQKNRRQAINDRVIKKDDKPCITKKSSPLAPPLLQWAVFVKKVKNCVPICPSAHNELNVAVDII